MYVIYDNFNTLWEHISRLGKLEKCYFNFQKNQLLGVRPYCDLVLDGSIAQDSLLFSATMLALTENGVDFWQKMYIARLTKKSVHEFCAEAETREKVHLMKQREHSTAAARVDQVFKVSDRKSIGRLPELLNIPNPPAHNRHTPMQPHPPPPTHTFCIQTWTFVFGGCPQALRLCSCILRMVLLAGLF